MHNLELFLTENHITFGSAITRLLLSFIAGGIIGINREKQNQAAGFRTHILISTGSCLLMLVSIYIPQEFQNFKNGDPGRIASQVITGIGFLGAGAIIRLGDQIKGLTTAATIWIVAAIGLSIGAGMFYIGAVAVVIVIITLALLDNLETMVFKKKHPKRIAVQLKQPHFDISSLKQVLDSFQLKYQIVDYVHTGSQGCLTVEIMAQVPANFNAELLLNKIKELPNVLEIQYQNRV